MPDYLCITVTFLDPRFHGRGDGGVPEWPPSPLRLLQAIVAANADSIGLDGELDSALAWLESQPPPLIVAPRERTAEPCCLSVPNNAMDIIGKAWSRGNYFGGGDASPATHRTMKTVRPTQMLDGDRIHYLWELSAAVGNGAAPIIPLTQAASRLVALGWGIDLVVGHAERCSSEQLAELPGERWRPTALTNVAALRTPVPGTLAALLNRHDSFLRRIGNAGFAPVEPLKRFEVTGYQRPTDPTSRPWVVFELRHDDGSFCQYSQRKLIHIAGMVRHLAKEAMLLSPPMDVGDDWVERYVVGHRDPGAVEHRQFSYLPLPSIRAPHEPVHPAVRRVMVAAPFGDEAWLKHLADRLAGRQLKPERGVWNCPCCDKDPDGNETPKGPPTLVRVYRDNVTQYYTAGANQWASVTPVILPGHDDRNPARRQKLIAVALKQSGIEQRCDYEWSPYSQFRQSLSAHKYNRDRQQTGYFRPDHLQTQTAVHLKLTFRDGLEVSGPIAIGAGRHCGLGILAAAADR